MSESRFIDLESKVSHQEFLLEKLNALIQEHEITIYQLEARVSVLDKKIHELMGLGNEVGPANQKPPHY